MKKIANLLFFLCLITILIGQNKIDDFDMYSYPTKFEFTVYKLEATLMMAIPFEDDNFKETENAIVDMVAKKYSITSERAAQIYMKLEYYNTAQDFNTGKLIETMSWKEFQRLSKKMGPPWPKDKKKQ